ncbi:MAG: carboxypeptidase-like regulatory domain-containing protein [Bacteroidota bacterium]|nr:carboxypeptidase-like regulatory domain-containing protein [Bacteroidota bacterium]
MKNYFYITIALSLFSINLFSQDWTFVFSSKIEKEGKPMGGASIKLFNGSTLVSQTTSDGDGYFKLNIPPNGNYSIVMSSPGHITKKVDASTMDVPADKTSKNFKTSLNIESFSLFEPLPGIDYSALNQPLLKIAYNGSKSSFSDDKAYTDQILNILQKIKTDERELIKKYESAIAIADAAFTKQDWVTAKSNYEKSLTLLPGKKHPIDRLALIQKIEKEEEELTKKAEADKIATEKAAKEKIEADKLAAEKAAKDKAETEKLAAEKLVAEKAAKDKAEAEKLAAEKAAKDKAEAEKLAAEKAAKDKAEADKLAAENANKAKAEAQKAAKDKEEADRIAKEKLNAEKIAKKLAAEKAAAEKDKAEQLAIEKAKEEKLKNKAEKEKEAAEKDKAEQLAIEKAKAEKLAKEEDEKIKIKETEAITSEQIGRKEAKHSIAAPIGKDLHKEAVKKADGYFKMKRYQEAKDAYQEALKIKAEDIYSSNRIAEIEKLLNK